MKDKISILRLCLVSTINFVMFALCAYLTAAADASTFEGLVPAMLCILFLFVSILLAGFGINQLLIERKGDTVELKTILATLYAALPLILLFLAIVFGRKPRL